MMRTIDQQILTKPQNQKYLVSLTVIIAFLILYLTNCSLKHVYERNLLKLKEIEESKNELLRNEQEKELKRRSKILETFLEHKDRCYDIQVFTKKEEIYEAEENGDEFDYDTESMEESLEEEIIKTEVENKKSHIFDQKRARYKIPKFKKKTTLRKKDISKKSSSQPHQSQSKKNSSSSEPIIYLFALIFIYLLLKAASDISQHYKMVSVYYFIL